IDQIFEASSKVEHLFKTLLQDEIVSTSKETALLIQYAEFVSDYLHLLRQGNTAKLDAVYATFERVWNDYGFAVTETNSIQTQGLVSKLVELDRSEEHTSELQSRENLVCRLLLEKKTE